MQIALLGAPRVNNGLLYILTVVPRQKASLACCIKNTAAHVCQGEANSVKDMSFHAC